MMVTHTMDATRRMAGLRQAYLDNLKVRLKEASEALGEQAGECDLTQVRAILHDLSGSAGSFGYVQLGENARELEHIARQGLESGELRAEHYRQLRQGVLTLQSMAVGDD